MRPSRDYSLVASAFVWSRRSTCARLQVGALVHREGRILVQGYNGAPAGLPHCNHQCNCRLMGSRGEHIYHPESQGHLPTCPSLPEYCRAVHAEQNAIAFAARHGVRLEGGELVSTHQPCLSCARSIINSGIVKVLYVEPYRLTDGLDLLIEAGLAVERFVDWDGAV